MYRHSLLLACMVGLALGTAGRADELTTNITIVGNNVGGGTGQSGSGTNQINGTQSSSQTASYTTTTSGAVGSPVYAVGVVPLTGYGANPPNPGGALSFPGVDHYLGVFALEGVQATPTAPGGFTANFTHGVVKFFDVGTGAFPSNLQVNPAFWTSGTLVYTAKLGSVNTSVGQGLNPLGSLGGLQPGGFNNGQNTATFVPSTTTQTPGAVIINTVANPGTFVTTPNPFDGFQIKLQEVNVGPTGLGGQALPSNAQLDAAFAAIADAIDTFSTLAPFTATNFNPTLQGPDTVQIIGVQLYPITSTTTQITIPEPASMLVWAGIAAGLGIYRGVRRSRSKKA
jgi:hypothetical protein